MKVAKDRSRSEWRSLTDDDAQQASRRCLAFSANTEAQKQMQKPFSLHYVDVDAPAIVPELPIAVRYESHDLERQQFPSTNPEALSIANLMQQASA